MFEKDQIKAILFYLDGTLMDTDDQTVARLAGWLGKLRWRDPERAARWMVMTAETPGNAFITLLDAVGLDRPVRFMANRVSRLWGHRAPAQFEIIVGVQEMLAQVGARYRLAVVSTRGRKDSEAFLAQYGLQDLFEVVVTSESTWRLKPHPAPVLYAAERLGLDPQHCLMVGDTTVDIKSALRAGAWSVGVLCGFGMRRELERVGAHVILDSTADLAAIV